MFARYYKYCHCNEHKSLITENTHHCLRTCKGGGRTRLESPNLMIGLRPLGGELGISGILVFQKKERNRKTLRGNRVKYLKTKYHVIQLLYHSSSCFSDWAS